MPPDDGEPLSVVNQHDNKIFEKLFATYKDPVFRFAAYLTQNKKEAEDLFQEAWLRVVKYFPKTTEVKDFQAWLFTIVMNIHRDELRKKRIRRIMTPWRSVEDKYINSEETHGRHLIVPKTDDDSNSVDIKLALVKAISQLPTKQRQVFLLKEIEGFKHTEISKILNIPTGTVKSLLHRSVKKLQSELSEFRTES